MTRGRRVPRAEMSNISTFIAFVRVVVPSAEEDGAFIRLPSPDTIRVSVAQYCYDLTQYEDWWEPEAIENAVRAAAGAKKYGVLRWLMDYADRIERQASAPRPS